jgi:hypothetical protein
MGRRLKVFTAPIGFHEAVVAAPSRPAALKAWGVHQDLFKAGAARETTEADLVAAAIARPGEVLLRPLAQEGAIKSAPRVAKARARAKPSPPAPSAKASKAVKRRPKPPPDRGELTRAEAALDRLLEAHAEARAALKVEADDLAARRRTAESRFGQAQRQARAAVAAARRRLRAAGGA